MKFNLIMFVCILFTAQFAGWGQDAPINDGWFMTTIILCSVLVLRLIKNLEEKK